MTKNESLGPSYCSYFWKHVCVRPDLEMQPCCSFEDEKSHPHKWSENFNQMYNNDFYKGLREKALRGERIPGCNKCYRKEKSGVRSLREFANQTLPNNNSLNVTPDEINSIEFFVGNVCNLKCLMCTPKLSSAWHQDYKALNWHLPDKIEDNNLAKIVEPFNNIESIKFVGGEPFLSKHHLQDLKVLLKKSSENMTLNYYTNATVWPTKEMRGLLSQFKRINMWLSIDGHDVVNEYIRFPSKWHVVEDITKKYIDLSNQSSNFSVRVVATVSVYNIFNMNKLEDWFFSIKNQKSAENLEFMFMNPLLSPNFLAPINLPEELKVEAIKILSTGSNQQQDIAHYLEQNKVDFDESLIDYTRKLDKVRKIHIKDYVPELTKLIY